MSGKNRQDGCRGSSDVWTCMSGVALLLVSVSCHVLTETQNGENMQTCRATRTGLVALLPTGYSVCSVITEQ